MLVFKNKNKIYHLLSYQCYCYDLILGNKVDLMNYHLLYDFMKSLWKKKQFPNVNEYKNSKAERVFKKEKWWSWISLNEKNIFLKYYPFSEDPAFNQLAFQFIRAFYGLCIILHQKEKKSLGDMQYIELVKIINNAFDQWIEEWKDLTIDFNLIVRNTYQIFPRNLLRKF